MREKEVTVLIGVTILLILCLTILGAIRAEATPSGYTDVPYYVSEAYCGETENNTICCFVITSSTAAFSCKGIEPVIVLNRIKMFPVVQEQPLK